MITTIQTPTQILTIRVHLLQKNLIIATYAVGSGKRFKVGNKVYENTSKKALKRCKLEILNRALETLGSGKKVSIEIEERLLQEFIDNDTLKNEKHYQDLADDIRINLNLCSSVTCKSTISHNAFNAALDEYRSVKQKVLHSDIPTYKELFAQHRRMAEARKYEQAISNW